MFSISSGRLKDRIDIQQRTTTQDATGQPIESWTTVLPGCAAEILHVSGLQTIKGGADVSIVKVSIRLRYRTDIDETMRVLHGSTLYAINALLPNRSGGWLDLVCQVTK
jgi:SPP1 family predicted phage head-tail adaptor